MGPDIDNETERELNVHIFSVSAQLVGICLTVIGLFRVVGKLRAVDSIADDLLAADAIAFLSACVVAYASLRAHSRRRRRALERVADVCFGTALLLMTVVCALITWRLV
jgi:hypothetical protein